MMSHGKESEFNDAEVDISDGEVRMEEGEQRIVGWHFPELEVGVSELDLSDDQARLWDEMATESVAEIWGIDLDDPIRKGGPARFRKMGKAVTAKGRLGRQPH